MQTLSSPRLCEDNNKSGLLAPLELARSSGSLAVGNVRSNTVQGPQAVAASPQPEPQPEPQLPVASIRLCEPAQLSARNSPPPAMTYATSFSTSYACAAHRLIPSASNMADVSRIASDLSNHHYGYSDAGSAGSTGVSRMASDAGAPVNPEAPHGHITSESTKRVCIAGVPSSQLRETQRSDSTKSTPEEAEVLISPVAHHLAERIKLLQVSSGVNAVDSDFAQLQLRIEHEANQQLLQETETQSEHATVKRLRKENEANQRLLEESENERASLQVLLGALAAQFNHKNSPTGKTSGAPALNLKHAKHFAAIEEERSRSSRTIGSSSVVSSTTTLAPTADPHDGGEPSKPKTQRRGKQSEFVVHGLAGVWMCRSLGRLGLKTLRASWQKLASKPREISSPCTLQPSPSATSEIRSE